MAPTSLIARFMLIAQSMTSESASACGARVTSVEHDDADVLVVASLQYLNQRGFAQRPWGAGPARITRIPNAAYHEPMSSRCRDTQGLLPRSQE